MTPEEFARMIQSHAQQSKAFVERDLPDLVGTEATKHFKENFEKEGFVDASPKPWKEVKRRMNPRTRGVRKTNKILHDSGELQESISYEKEPGKVVIYSDKPYASAHNKGTTTAGRGRSTTIPKRQFIGHSEKLDEKIRKEIEDGLGKIFIGK